MARPRDPMLKEFALVAEKGPDSVEEVCALFTEDCILEDTSSPEVVRGRGALGDYCAEFFSALPDLKIEPIEIFEEGLTAVMYLRLSGTHRAPWMGVEPSGNRISYRAVAIYRCNEDCSMVAYETFSYDAATILAQLRGEREAEDATATSAAVS